MSKPWTPKILNPSAVYMHEQYGMTEGRRVELSIRMTKMTHQESTTVTPVSSHIAQIAEMCDTPGEFAFCVFVHATYLATTQNVISL